jgi:hypothetical protein
VGDHFFDYDRREQARHNESLNLQKKLLTVQENLLAAQENRVALKWCGKLRDLGILIVEQYNLKNIQAKSYRHAIELVCAHFVDKRGKQINVRSLCENMRHKNEVPQNPSRSRQTRKVAYVQSKSSKT